jgi:hypothetical protein
MDCNPYASPAIQPSTTRRRSRLQCVAIFTYLLVFCLLHAAHFWMIAGTVATERLVPTLVFSAAVPILVAVSVALYAINVTPRRYIRFWQTVPCLTLLYVVISLRITYDRLGASPLSATFFIIVAAWILLYGPALYMSYKLTGVRPYWAFPAGEKASDEAQKP